MLWFFWTLQFLLQRWCLTCLCVHTLTPRRNREGPEFGKYFMYMKLPLHKYIQRTFLIYLVRRIIPFYRVYILRFLLVLRVHLLKVFSFVQNFLFWSTFKESLLRFFFKIWPSACSEIRRRNAFKSTHSECYYNFHRLTLSNNGKIGLIKYMQYASIVIEAFYM